MENAKKSEMCKVWHVPQSVKHVLIISLGTKSRCPLRTAAAAWAIKPGGLRMECYLSPIKSTFDWSSNICTTIWDF